MTESSKKTPFGDAMAAGIAMAGAINNVGHTPFTIIPDGYAVKDLEQMLPTPTRLRGVVRLHDAASFCAYVNAYADATSRVYLQADTMGAEFTAALNHGGWRDHKAHYKCTTTPEWQTWVGANRKSMSQADFAAYIEDNLLDIVVPEGAKMLEVSRSLQAKRAVSFTSAVRLDNGDTEFLYEEETKGTSKGKLDIPTEFVISVSPFVGTPTVETVARLRYRINDGKLVMWYELVRPHKVVEEAVNSEIARIEELIGIKIWRGVAP